jgi:hypothetical protein
MSVEFEVVMVTGDRRVVVLPSHTGSLGNALDRLDAWIETKDGGWVQKRFVVEVRPLEPTRPAPASEESG